MLTSLKSKSSFQTPSLPLRLIEPAEISKWHLTPNKSKTEFLLLPKYA